MMKRLKIFLTVLTGLLLPFLLLAVLTLRPVQASSHTTIYVKADAAGANDGSSWADAYTDLQGALAEAGTIAPTDTVEIWVAAGTYKPTTGSDRAATFNLPDGVALYGGFVGNETSLAERDWVANPTILSGEIGSPTSRTDNSRHVVTINNVNSAYLDGFTIRGGTTEEWGWPGMGAGIHSSSSNVTLRNLLITENRTEFGGAGMLQQYGQLTIDNVQFLSNTATGWAGGGLRVSNAQALTVTNSLFEKNSSGSTGGGVFLEWVDLIRMNRVSIRQNEAKGAGGIFIFRGVAELQHLTVTGNIVHGSSGGAGMVINGVDGDGGASLRHALISGNRSVTEGAAMLTNVDWVTLDHVTITGNQAETGTGGIVYRGQLTATNSIIWNEPPAEGSDEGELVYLWRDLSDPIFLPVISYSVVRGGYEGAGNQATDPLFVDPLGADGISGTADDDLRLHPTSPAIDAGSNAAVPAGVTVDLAGQPRFVDMPNAPDVGLGDGPLVDIGAYEARYPELVLTKTVTPATALPGQTITYTLVFSNTGPVTATRVVLSDIIPSAIEVTGVSASRTITDRGATPGYSWEVGELVPGAQGQITITGVISPDLALDSRFEQVARIATAEMEDERTNEAVAPLVVTLPRARFEQARYEVAETAGEVVLQVLLDQPNPYATLSLDYTSNLAGAAPPLVEENLTFPAGSAELTIRVPVQDDQITEMDETIEVRLSNPHGLLFGSPMTATIVVADDDVAGVEVSHATVEVGEDGTTASYSVQLTSQPVAPVTLAVETDEQLTVEPATLTFTAENWDQPQSVTVAAPDDQVAESSGTTTLRHQVTSEDELYASLAVADVQVTITDNDEAGVQISRATVEVGEDGTTASYSVQLTSQPVAPVTLAVETDEQLAVEPATLTFTAENWDQPQSITVSAVSDNRAEGTHQVAIEHRASSQDGHYHERQVAPVTVQIRDHFFTYLPLTRSAPGTAQAGAKAESLPQRLPRGGR